jgi:hypothetical protein
MVEMVAAKHGDLPAFRCYASYFPEADNDRPLLESYDLLPLGVIRRGRAPCRCTDWVSSMRSVWSATSHQSQRPQFGMSEFEAAARTACASDHCRDGSYGDPGRVAVADVLRQG